jgi:TonB family protein
MKVALFALVGSFLLHFVVWQIGLSRKTVATMTLPRFVSPIEFVDGKDKVKGKPLVARTPHFSGPAAQLSIREEVEEQTYDERRTELVSEDQIRGWGNAPPRYPKEAESKGWTGALRLRIQFTNLGNVDAVDVIASSGIALLDEAALSAARRWKLPNEVGWNSEHTKRVPLEVPIEFKLVD